MLACSRKISALLQKITELVDKSSICPKKPFQMKLPLSVRWILSKVCKSEFNILLGAGFSRPAGLPLVSNINDYFNKKIYDRLRMHSSSEWFWKENEGDVINDNGSLNSDHIIYAFVFDEIMKEYGELKNYEDFYDFLINKKSVWYKSVFDTAKAKCIAQFELPAGHDIISMFETYQYGKIIEIFNYLIIDTLRIKKSDDHLKLEYSSFLRYLTRAKQVNVFTLNHDLLLEHLLNINDEKYSDGFSEEDSPLIGDDNRGQPVFRNIYQERIRIRKMHGGAGFYRYPLGADGSGIFKSAKKVLYFKPTSFQNKHMARRVNRFGKVLQSMNLDVSPKFITGRNKKELIAKDPMYAQLYKAFHQKLTKTLDLMIIGYSFGDDHINEALRTCGPYRHVINVNPGPGYPFTNARTVTNLHYISDINTLLK
jgi:hypothetical protein